MNEIKNGRYEEKFKTSWYLNNNLHREGRPAVEWLDGSKNWFFNGNLHFEDGPAMEYADGRKEWYLDGQELTEKEFKQWKDKQNLNKKLEIKLLPKAILKKFKI